MTTTTSPSIVDALTAFVDDDSKQKCTELTRAAQQLAEPLGRLVENAKEICDAMEARGEEHFQALTAAMDPDAASEIEDGWLNLWAHVTGEQALSDAMYNLLQIATSFDNRPADAEVSE
jgi:hypothetical protein